MTIIGHGVDLVDLVRFEEELKLTPSLAEALFCSEELFANSRQLAGNFAAKEALFKALPQQSNFNFKACAVLRQKKTQKPYFIFYDNLASVMKNLKVHLTLANTQQIVVATVILEQI